MRAWAITMALLAAGAAQGQGRLVQALVYPGGAELQRVAAVAAGTRELVLNCLPARFDVESLRVSGSAGVRVGDVRVETLARERAPECSGNGALDARILTLEEQKAGLLGDKGGLDLVLGYLGRTGGDAKMAVPSAATAEALRRQGSEALKSQSSLQRRIDELDRQLAPLLAQREQERNRVAQWQRVSVRLAAEQDGQLHISYQTRFAGWTPRYQADLQEERGQIAFERRAEVKQATGEVWTDIKLVLSTRQPQRATGVGEPQPWWLRRVEPARAEPTIHLSATRAYAPAALPAPAPMAARAADERFEVVALQTDIDAQFSVPGAVSLAADSEARSFTLERLNWPATVVAQVQPAQAPQAFVMATIKRPEGFFPPGALHLLREGQFVGRGAWQLGSETEQRLFFGPEDRIRVRVEPEQREGSEAGFIGSRRVATLKRAWVLENLGAKALPVQLVEAAPFPQHQDIEVSTRFEPQPAETRWRGLDGITLWRATLAPKQSLRLQADYRISVPKEMMVGGMP